MTGSSVEILLVEDNPGDVDLIRESLREAKIANHLHVVPDGVAAMAFLRGCGGELRAPRPDLVLLDLNLPRKDGREVLREMRADPRFSTIPVVVMTSSEAESDIARSYALHANCYVVKPLDFDQFVAVVRAIEEFWLTVVRLPPDTAASLQG